MPKRYPLVPCEVEPGINVLEASLLEQCSDFRTLVAAMFYQKPAAPTQAIRGFGNKAL